MGHHLFYVLLLDIFLQSDCRNISPEVTSKKVKVCIHPLNMLQFSKIIVFSVDQRDLIFIQTC